MVNILKNLGLVLLGALLMSILVVSAAPGLVVNELKSPYDFNKTVEVLQENIKKQGWGIKNVANMQKIMKKKLNKDILPTKVIKLGNAKYAHALVSKDETRFVSTMMPHSISVYEKSDGNTYIALKNMGLMGKIFGGEIERIMGKVQADDDVILEFAKQ